LTFITPEDAESRDCIGPPNAGYTRSPLERCCIGKACKMAWRWEDGKEIRGYCGLAGRPFDDDLKKG